MRRSGIPGTCASICKDMKIKNMGMIDLYMKNIFLKWMIID